MSSARLVMPLAAMLVILSGVPADAAGPRPGLTEATAAVRVGRPAPALAGPTVGGAPFDLSALRRRVVLIDFSSIFCAACQETIRDFKRLESAYGPDGLALVLVSADGRTPVATLRNYFGREGGAYPVVLDPAGSLSAAWGVEAIPCQFLVDRDGIVRKINYGFDPALDTLLDLKALLRSPASGR
jgi:cytochrome c biogenesis protein CcmG/thiol:disulfide interchange protein DsbE